MYTRESIMVIRNNNHWYKTFTDCEGTSKQIRVSKKEAIEDIEMAREKGEIICDDDISKKHAFVSYYN